MTRPIDTPVQGKEALMYWFIETSASDLNKLPEDVRTKLEAYISPSTNSVDASVWTAELTYARADDLPVELLAIGASCAAMVAANNFHDMGERGLAIAQVLRARPGVLRPKSTTKLETPEPKAEYTAPVVEATPETT